MGNSLVAFLSAQASITFPNNFNFYPVLAQIFSFYFSSDFSIRATSTIRKMYVIYCKRNYFIDISHRCKNLPDPVRGLWSCRSSTAKGLRVFKVCIDSSEHRGTLPPLFSHHAEGRDHQTEISTPQQAPGKAERRMCVPEGICTTKTPLF